MTKITIDIKTCQQCPFFKTGNHWSSDGFDRMENWICTKENNKVIAPSVEWHEEKDVKIPDWCPIKT